MRLKERRRIPDGASLRFRINLFTSCNCNVLHVRRHTLLRPSWSWGLPDSMTSISMKLHTSSSRLRKGKGHLQLQYMILLSRMRIQTA